MLALVFFPDLWPKPSVVDLMLCFSIPVPSGEPFGRNEEAHADFLHAVQLSRSLNAHL